MLLTTQKTIIGYKLVKEYPLKNIGDMVIFKAGYNGWFWEKSPIEKIELPILKTDFFEPVYSKRAIGELALLEPFGYQVKINKILTENKYEIEISGNGKKKIVYEKDLKDIKSYWFFNSSLVACQIEITSKEKLKDWEERKKVGNCFSSKAECQIIIFNIKNILKNKL